MKLSQNPYINSFCPVTGNAIETNSDWDIELDNYKVYFGVIEGRIILLDCHGIGTGDTSIVYERHLQKIVAEGITPGATYATCDDYTNFRRATAKARSIFMDNLKHFHPNIRGAYCYNAPAYFRFSVMAAKRFIKTHYDFSVATNYKHALELAYASIDVSLVLAVNQLVNNKDYYTKSDWQYACGKSGTAEFRIISGNIIHNEIKAGCSFEQLDRLAELFVEVIEYVKETTSSEIYYVIVNISNLTRESISIRRYHINNMKRANELHPCAFVAVMGTNFFSQMALAFARLRLPYKMEAATSFENAMHLIEQFKMGVLEKESKGNKQSESDVFLQYLGAISWAESGITFDNSPPNDEEMKSVFDAINMIKMDIDELLQERDEKEKELKALSEELKLANEDLEHRVEERTKELVVAKEMAEDANRTKSDFLAKISHELRTPMHGILSFSRFGITKANRVSTEKLVHYFENIHDSGDRLMSLVNDLLDISKLESGKMPFDLKMHDVIVNIEAIKSQLSPLLVEHKIKLTIGNKPFGNLLYDKDRIMQVFTNLIGNAIKFLGQGGAISISFDTSVVSGKKYAQINIQDDGIGVPEGELEQIFESFNQSSATRSKAGGTGLGLTISKDIVLGHNGQIYATHAPQSGTIFTVELPINP